MNLGQVIGEGGVIDPELVEALRADRSNTSPNAQVTVRQWNARVGRHEVLYRGPHRAEVIRKLDHDQQSMMTEDASEAA